MKKWIFPWLLMTVVSVVLLAAFGIENIIHDKILIQEIANATQKVAKVRSPINASSLTNMTAEMRKYLNGKDISCTDTVYRETTSTTCRIVQQSKD